MITKLRLENWKTHKDSELEFDKGTNVLIGKMGSGENISNRGYLLCIIWHIPCTEQEEVSIEEVILKSHMKRG